MAITVEGAYGSGASRAWISGVARRAAEAVKGEKKDLAIIFVKAARIKELNGSYRGKLEPTDILSFPADRRDDLGDILICPPVARLKAKKRGVGYREYLELLIVHGILHLAGYDHMSAKDAERMEKMEDRILKAKK